TLSSFVAVTYLFVFQSYAHHRDLHSFPTRRSSDLTSQAMVSDKVRHIKDTGAEYVTGGDSSCLMNIGGSLSRQQAGVRAIHMAEILASTKQHPWTPTSAIYSREKML